VSTQTAPTAADLQAIAEQLWASYLDPEGGRPLLQIPVSGTTDISAAVSVTGSWNGHVVIETTASGSRQAAAAMLSMEGDEVSDADIADALGEIANVIGGGVKGLLPGTCALSLPHVVSSPGSTRHWPAVAEVCQIEASWMDEPVRVTVYESRQERPGS
jgi:chemotaxis protein CheX